MRFFCTDEDKLTLVRGSEIRAALVYARHEVVRGDIGVAAPADTDVWIYGMGVAGAPPLEDQIVAQLLASPANIVLAQLCDHPTMSFERIPAELAARARLFLRNHWPANEQEIPEAFRSRVGFLPPMIKTTPARPGRELTQRSIGAIFFGSRTGFSNLPGGKNAREETVRIMRASGLPFLGGLLPHEEKRYHTDPALLVPKLRQRHHRQHLVNSKICLAPWGNHPLSYRLFEGLAMRCLVIAQPVRSSRLLDGGLEPGKHYVEVAPDLSDLVDTVRYYLTHLDEAQAIANAGHEIFKRCLAPRGELISQWIFDSVVASWGDVYRPGTARGIAVEARRLAARLWPNRF